MIMTMAEKEIRICSCCSLVNVPLNTRSGHGHECDVSLRLGSQANVPDHALCALGRVAPLFNFVE